MQHMEGSVLSNDWCFGQGGCWLGTQIKNLLSRDTPILGKQTKLSSLIAGSLIA